MDFQEMMKQAREVRDKYAELNQKQGNKPWGVAEHAQGFVGDVGDLVKLIMAKSGFRKYGDLDKKIAHELADCLWSILVIADELGVDLERALLATMDELRIRIENESK